MALENTNKSMEVALASKLQLQLEQPMADITTKLVNKDFEGEFFKIGDTVTIVKPSLDSIVVEDAQPIVGTFLESALNDARLTPQDIDFERDTLRIDSTMKYAFKVSDINKAEGKWDYASGGLDMAAHKIRIKHNLRTAELILKSEKVARIGSPSAPLGLTSVDELYEKVLVPMYTTLYSNGAITADGQVTFGSNPVEGKATSAGVFMPADVFGALLQSKYLTDRSTTAADDKVATANIKQVLGMDIAVEPALDQKSKYHVTVESLAEGTYAIIAGTKNVVTRAGKVLPPDRFRSHTNFAEEFHGIEIYGEKVAQPEAAIVAFVTLP